MHGIGEFGAANDLREVDLGISAQQSNGDIPRRQLLDSYTARTAKSTPACLPACLPAFQVASRFRFTKCRVDSS